MKILCPLSIILLMSAANGLIGVDTPRDLAPQKQAQPNIPINRHLQTSINNLDAIIKKADSLTAKGKFKLANEKYRQVDKVLKNLMKQKMLEAADLKNLQALREKLNTNWSASMEKAAWAFFKNKEYRLAIKMAQYALEINPKAGKKLQKFIDTCKKMPGRKKRVGKEHNVSVTKPSKLYIGNDAYYPVDWSAPQISTSPHGTTISTPIPTFRRFRTGVLLNVGPPGSR